MINPASSNLYLSNVNSLPKTFSYTQLFDLKAKKLESEYMKNRGSSEHYRSWISLLADANRFDTLVEVMLAYRHDSADFDAINSLYLAKRDYELFDDCQGAFNLSMVFIATFPEDFEGFFFASRLSNSFKGTLAENHPLEGAFKSVFKENGVNILSKMADKGIQYQWLREYALFRNPKYAPSSMQTVPAYILIDIVLVVLSRKSSQPIPALHDQIQMQLKANPFNVRLMAVALCYYCSINDSALAEKYYNLLIQLATNPADFTLYSFITYEKFKGNLVKALEWSKHGNATYYTFMNRLVLLEEMRLFDEFYVECDRNLSKYENKNDSHIQDYRLWYSNSKLNKLLNAADFHNLEIYAERLLKTNPKHIRAIQAKIAVASFKNNFSEAWKLHESKCSLAPEDEDAICHSKISLKSYQRFRESETQLRNHIFIFPNSNKFVEALFYIYFYQKKYEEALALLENRSNLTEGLLLKREIALFRLNRPRMLSTLNFTTVSRRLKNYFLAEVEFSLGRLDEAKQLFKEISVFEDVGTLEVYLRLLMKRGEVAEAKAFLNQINEERKLRLSAVRIEIQEARVIEKVTPKLPVEVKRQNVESFNNKILIGLTPNAISLLKEGFSRKPCCGNEGVDPLIYPCKINLDINTPDVRPALLNYPDAYCDRIRSALELFEHFKSIYDKPHTRTNAYQLIYCLKAIIDQLCPKNPNQEFKEGMALFSKRVVSIDVLASIRFTLLQLPVLVSPVSLFKFAKAFLSVEHSIKMSFSDPEPVEELTLFALENGESWDSLMDHIKAVLHFDIIREELQFLKDQVISSNEEENIPLRVSAARIRSACSFIYTIYPERGATLLKVFPELESDTAFGFSTRNIDRLIALSSFKAAWLEKV